jgi:hypothetical protein
MTLKPTEPVIYHRSIFRLASFFLPTLVLLPFLLLKANRQFKALVVLAPYAFFAIIAFLGKTLPPLQLWGPLDPSLSEVYPYIEVLAGSLCILCLILHAMPRWTILKKFILILALYLLPGLLILFITQSGGSSKEWIYPAVYGPIPLALLISGILAGRYCRTRWKLWRFSLVFYAWNALYMAVLVLLGLADAFRTVKIASLRFLELLIPIVAAPIIGSAVLFVITFPFILTIFRSPLYRERLMAAFDKTANRPVSQDMNTV